MMQVGDGPVINPDGDRNNENADQNQSQNQNQFPNQVPYQVPHQNPPLLIHFCLRPQLHQRHHQGLS